MKSYLLVLLFSSFGIHCAAQGADKEGLLKEVQKLELELLKARYMRPSKTRDDVLASLVGKSAELALRCSGVSLQEDDFEDDLSSESVGYNSKMNSIVAWKSRDNNGTTVTTTVIKYLGSGKIDVDTSIIVPSGMIIDSQLNPLIVRSLKAKIATFESTCSSSSSSSQV